MKQLTSEYPHFDHAADCRCNLFGLNDSSTDAELKSAEQTDDREPEASRFDFYNALYPWNGGVDFAKSSVVLEPERSGILYFRVNAAPKNLKRNGGRVKVQIKLLD